MSNKDSKRGGLLLPNSSSLFPMLRAQTKTVSLPTHSSNSNPYTSSEIDFASNINNGTNKLVYHRLYDPPTVGGGCKNNYSTKPKTNKPTKNPTKKPTKNPTKKPITQKNVI
jgi:hypothetical protein